MKRMKWVTGKMVKSIVASALAVSLALMMPMQAFAADYPSPDTPLGPDPEPQPTVEEPSGVYYDELLDKIKNAAAGTIKYCVGDSLPFDVLVAMLARHDLTLEFTYTLEDGTQGTVNIDYKDAMTLLNTKVVPWYGYKFLEQYIGSAATSQATSTTEYIIQTGDTLSGIAKRFGTTVDAIMAENSYLTDPDKIGASQKLKISNAGTLNKKTSENKLELNGGSLNLGNSSLVNGDSDIKLRNETPGKIAVGGNIGD